MEGQSPRGRGRRRCLGHKPMRYGSTPARAGETLQAVADGGHRRVNPRACGGDPSNGGGACGKWGQSPRVRGRQLTLKRKGYLQRSIPARAGETLPRNGNYCIYRKIITLIHSEVLEMPT